MCGIAGALTDTTATQQVLDALKRLEYRGYDSAGIATLSPAGVLERRRAPGKLSHLAAVLDRAPLEGALSIGHTRWATHGPATEDNAHPHTVGRVTVVHNGIIENYKTLSQTRVVSGWQPASQTDSETIAACLEARLEEGKSPEQALLETMGDLEGMFALLVVVQGFGDRFWFARRGSPLALGFGEKGVYAGSDAIALAGLASSLMHLEDNDWGVVARDGVMVFAADGAPVQRASVPMPVSAAAIEKAGHRHFMAKEIAEQPVVLAQAVKAYKRVGSALWGSVNPANLDKVEAVACGTAALAAEIGSFWMEDWARLAMTTTIASESRHRPLLGDGARIVSLPVSQSGETADTIQAVRAAQAAGRASLAVVNVETSSIARMSDAVVSIHAGPEIGVASTKAFTCQLAALWALSLGAAERRDVMAPAQVAAHWEAMERMPALMATALASLDPVCEDIGRSLASYRSALFLGRGQMAALASEAALKLKEISYIHAEGYAAGELKHGPIALIDEDMPVIVFAPSGSTYDKTRAAVEEVNARFGKVILVSDAAGLAAAGPCWKTILMPSVPEALAPFLYALPAQLLAYHTAVAKGTDVDQPRNLAKSVTVE